MTSVNPATVRRLARSLAHGTPCSAAPAPAPADYPHQPVPETLDRGAPRVEEVAGCTAARSAAPAAEGGPTPPATAPSTPRRRAAASASAPTPIRAQAGDNLCDSMDHEEATPTRKRARAPPPAADDPPTVDPGHATAPDLVPEDPDDDDEESVRDTVLQVQDEVGAVGVDEEINRRIRAQMPAVLNGVVLDAEQLRRDLVALQNKSITDSTRRTYGAHVESYLKFADGTYGYRVRGTDVTFESPDCELHPEVRLFLPHGPDLLVANLWLRF